jgi:hypothetical protein
MIRTAVLGPPPDRAGQDANDRGCLRGPPDNGRTQTGQRECPMIGQKAGSWKVIRRLSSAASALTVLDGRRAGRVPRSKRSSDSEWLNNVRPGELRRVPVTSARSGSGWAAASARLRGALASFERQLGIDGAGVNAMSIDMREYVVCSRPSSPVRGGRESVVASWLGDGITRARCEPSHRPSVSHGSAPGPRPSPGDARARGAPSPHRRFRLRPPEARTGRAGAATASR